MSKNKVTEEQLASEVESILGVEQSLLKLEQELAQDERFRQFLTKQKDYTDQIKAFWKQMEAKMIENNIRSIKGDWGSITIAERHNWKTTDKLARRFHKVVVDTKKLTDYFLLTDKEPTGAKHSIKKYLTKRIKTDEQRSK